MSLPILKNFDLFRRQLNAELAGMADVARGALSAAMPLTYNSTTGQFGISTTPTFSTVTLSGGQLVFPATQNPSSNANTLDDYEEGTWSPTIAFGGASSGVTYGAGNAGVYVKIGRAIFLHFLLQLTSKGVSTGNAAIGGLPFAASTTAWTGGSVRYGGMNEPGNYATMNYALTNTGSTIPLDWGEAPGVVNVNDTHFTGSSIITGSVIYTRS